MTRTQVDSERKPYRRPELTEYGDLGQLTLGSEGPHFDFSISHRVLTISNDCPQSQLFCLVVS